MKVIKSKQKDNTMFLEIEVSPDTISTSMDKVFKDVVKHAKVAGFRQGKVPRDIFEKNYGTEVLVKDGLSDAVNTSYVQAITELKLDIVDYPKNVNIGEYKENSPVNFTCEVDVKPQIKVDKYKGVKVEKEPVEIDPDLVDAQIKQLLNSHVEYKVVDRAVEEEDLLKVNIKASIEGAEFSRWTKQNVGVGVGSSIFSAKFDANLVGKKANEMHSFSVSYDDDYYLKDVAGKSVDFEATITEVKGKNLPELTEEFVKKVSNNQFNNEAELRTNIKTSLEDQRTKDSEEKLKNAIIEKILEKNSFDIPQGMIQQEIDADKRYYENTLGKSGSSIENYLSMMKQSMEDFEKQLEEGALKRVKSQLILEGIARKESISASDDDMKDEIKKMKPDADNDEKVTAELAKINQDGFKNMITQRKVFDFLIDHAKIKVKKS